MIFSKVEVTSSSGDEDDGRGRWRWLPGKAAEPELEQEVAIMKEMFPD